MNSEKAVLTGTFIRIIDEGVPKSLKTHVYRVEAIADMVDATDDAPILGTIKWFGRWRCYAFFPGVQTVFEKTCMRQIAAFMQEETVRHRNESREAAGR